MLKDQKGEDWDKQEDVIIEGGNWATGENAVTLGIWMWIWPHEIHNVIGYSTYFAYMYFC